MRAKLSLLDRFFKVLVDEIRNESPEYLTSSFTVAEIYQSLVPYRTHRDRIGAEMNGDYEDALLRLLAGEGGYLRLESETAQERIRLELRSSNPNTGLYREYAAVGVRLSPEKAGGAGGSASELDEGDGLDLDDLLSEVSQSSPSDDEDEPGAKAADASKAPGVGAAASTGASDASGSVEGTKEPPEKPQPAAADSGSPASGPDPAEPARAAAPNGTNGGERERKSSRGASGGGAAPEPPATIQEPDPDARPDGCPDCGTSLPDRERLRFCPLCGANVFVAPCSACGEVLERRWSFCIACGTAAG